MDCAPPEGIEKIKEGIALIKGPWTEEVRAVCCWAVVAAPAHSPRPAPPEFKCLRRPSPSRRLSPLAAARAPRATFCAGDSGNS